LPEVQKDSITFLAGDYNLDLIKSDSHAPTEEFVNLLASHSFLPTIHFPTRITATTASLIDNVFVNSILLNFDTGIIYSDISDHLPILLHVNIVIKKKSCIPVIKRMYSLQLIENFKVSLADTNWNDI